MKLIPVKAFLAFESARAGKSIGTIFRRLKMGFYPRITRVARNHKRTMLQVDRKLATEIEAKFPHLVMHLCDCGEPATIFKRGAPSVCARCRELERRQYLDYVRNKKDHHEPTEAGGLTIHTLHLPRGFAV